MKNDEVVPSLSDKIAWRVAELIKYRGNLRDELEILNLNEKIQELENQLPSRVLWLGVGGTHTLGKTLEYWLRRRSYGRLRETVKSLGPELVYNSFYRRWWRWRQKIIWWCGRNISGAKLTPELQSHLKVEAVNTPHDTAAKHSAVNVWQSLNPQDLQLTDDVARNSPLPIQL